MSTDIPRRHRVFFGFATILLSAGAYVPAPAPVQPIPPSSTKVAPLPVITASTTQVDQTGEK